jgi:hydroxymethylbilane synthase
VFTIGSRGSKLALWQANWVKDRLAELGYECRIEIITTSGDRFQQGPLKEVGNKGLFTKEIEEALLEERVDLAVHSLKDMPTALPGGLQITATPAREDPRDAIIGSKLDDLKPGARIGTGSLRRIAQLSAYRADLLPEPMRGNVDTRLRKLDEGQYDAIVLAAAGLRRLGWADRIAEIIPPDIMCPAVGQGSLAVETRADGGAAMEACARLNHTETNAAITAERAVLEQLGGGCQVPVGAHAVVNDRRMHLRAIVASPDGKRVIRDQIDGAVADAGRLGHDLGQRLLSSGAREILAEVYGAAR